MPAVTNSTSRKMYSELVKGVDTYQNDAGVDFCFATVNVKGSATIDPIGTMLELNAAGTFFYPLATRTAWEASKAYTKGAVVVPTTRNGLEYVATNSDTSAATEPTWPLNVGGTVVETGDQAWIARVPFSPSVLSPLPNQSTICVTVGTAEGTGFNAADVTVSATSQKLTAIYRGAASLADDGLETSGIDAADIASFKAALAKQGISFVASSTDVVSTYIS